MIKNTRLFSAALLTALVLSTALSGCGGSDYQISEPVQVDASEYLKNNSNRSGSDASSDKSTASDESSGTNSDASTDSLTETTDIISSEETEDAGEYESSVIYKGSGFLINDYCVEVEDIKNWYIELYDNNKGKLYMGENKKGLITEWTLNGERLSIKAGSSEWGGKSSLKDGVLILDNEDYLLAFFADDKDTGDIKIVTEDEYKKLAGVE